MSNKSIMLEAARKMGREKQNKKITSSSFEYKLIFPNCTFWEHNNPIRYIDRIPMDSCFTVMVYLGCPFGSMPTHVDGGDPFEQMNDRIDFQALNNCKGADCEWFETGEENVKKQREDSK